MKLSKEFQSLIETHEAPFVVIDDRFEIVAVNQAFLEAYRVDADRVVGRHCYEVTHGMSNPCFEHGEDCPYQQVFEAAKPHAVLHTHFDSSGRVHLVRIAAHPIETSTGEILMGETYHELSVHEERCELAKQMAGRSAAFKHLVKQLHVAASSDAPVLLQGETGTGKELAAAFIHERSARRDKAFLTLDCTVLTEPLFESEVFGHERGAFTGSVGDKPGLFELAHGGTLFLDEIGEMPLLLQAKLLRVIESGQFRRVGGHKMRAADVRIVCATNRDLAHAEHFRRDLYYRIACVPIHLPPLRERLDDIPDLAQALLRCIGRSNKRQYVLAPDAFPVLQDYHYPGNIRELRNILAAAGLHSTDGNIAAAQIEKALHRPPRHDAPAPLAEPTPDQDSRPDGTSLAEREAAHIARLLQQFNGNRRIVAGALGISERTLYRRLKRYQLD